MTTFHVIYLSSWSGVCLLALVFLTLERKSCVLFRNDYWRFMFKPWKLGTFLIAGTGLTVIAPYTGDVTWDYPDSIVMSVLTFASAPWAVATLFLTFKRKVKLRTTFIAISIWMFSVSWFYDAYILIKIGFYPSTWSSNIILSSMLYGFGGLFWNLDWNEHDHVHFAFTKTDWPNPSPTTVFNKIFWYALPFMILASAMMLPFLWRYF